MQKVVKKKNQEEGKYCKMRVANDFNLELWPELTN